MNFKVLGVNTEFTVYVIRRKKDREYWTTCDRQPHLYAKQSYFTRDATLCHRFVSRKEAEGYTNTIARHEVRKEGELKDIVGEVEIVRVTITVQEHLD
jgi:hypothetical protein